MSQSKSSTVFCKLKLHSLTRVKYLHGMPWTGNPWKSMEIHGISWKSMEFDGIPWNFHGVSMEYPRSSMECHGGPWSIHGVPWNVMEFHGVP